MKLYDSVFKPDQFKNQVALITGGGTGIGRCVAHELASLGGIVVIAGRRKDVLEKTVQEISQTGGKAFSHTVNIRSEENVKALISYIIHTFGRLDLLVNNAGGQFLSPASEISVKGFKTVLELNVVGTFAVTKTAFDLWMKNHGGKIVNVIADVRNGFPLMVHTGAARKAVDNLTKTLCQEWSQYGIRINSVAPGTIISSGMSNYPPPVQQSVANDFHYQNPTGRLGTESEVSSAIVWLLSDGSSYVNGTTLKVDGGSSLSKGMFLPFEEHGKLKVYLGYKAADEYGRDIPKPFQELLQRYRDYSEDPETMKSKL